MTAKQLSYAVAERYFITFVFEYLIEVFFEPCKFQDCFV